MIIRRIPIPYSIAQRGAARALIRRTRQVTPRKFPTEKMIRIMLKEGQEKVGGAEHCRREGIHPANYHKWLEDVMKAGKSNEAT